MHRHGKVTIRQNYKPELVEWAIQEIEQLKSKNHRLTKSIGANAHVIVAHGIVPGSDGLCRCDGCRAVATAMDEAGHLDDVNNKWWLITNEEEE